MSERERLIPHQKYGEEAIDILNMIQNEGFLVGKEDKTMFGNAPVPKELVDARWICMFDSNHLDNFRNRLIRKFEEAMEDAMLAEKELDLYKAKYGPLPEEDETENA